LQKRIDTNEKGFGIGRINKPVVWNDGIYKLFFVSNIHKEIRAAAEKQVGF
jgi:hypothetical protein